MKCPACKKEFDNLSAFCTYCGFNFNDSAEVVLLTKKEKSISVFIRVLSAIFIAFCLLSIVDALLYFDLFDDFVVKFFHIFQVVQNLFYIVVFILLLANKIYCNKEIMIGIFSLTYVVSIVNIAIFYAYDTSYFQNDVGLLEKIVSILLVIVNYKIFVIIRLKKNKKFEKVLAIVICVSFVIEFISSCIVNPEMIYSTVVDFVKELPLILIFLLHPVFSEPLPSVKLKNNN